LLESHFKIFNPCVGLHEIFFIMIEISEDFKAPTYIVFEKKNNSEVTHPEEKFPKATSKIIRFCPNVLGIEEEG